MSEELNIEQAKANYAFYITEPIKRRHETQEVYKICDSESRDRLSKISETCRRQEIKQLAQYIELLESEGE